jgi:hypothetical protein
MAQWQSRLVTVLDMTSRRADLVEMVDMLGAIDAVGLELGRAVRHDGGNLCGTARYIRQEWVCVCVEGGVKDFKSAGLNRGPGCS